MTAVERIAHEVVTDLVMGLARDNVQNARLTFEVAHRASRVSAILVSWPDPALDVLRGLGIEVG